MTLSVDALQRLLVDSTIIQDSTTGPKVVKLANGHYLKFFRLKTWFSSALFYHYADRFFDNQQRLTDLGVVTVKPVAKYTIPRGFISESKITKAVEYKYLPGQTFRDWLASNPTTPYIIECFAKFIAKLHNKGIYFKATHFANIIYNSDFSDKFGLIDIDNTKIYKKSLSFDLRRRNFGHMLRYPEDRAWLYQNKQQFLDIYVANSAIKDKAINKLCSLLDT